MDLFCNALFSALIVGAFKVAPGVMKVDHYDYDTKLVTPMYIRTNDYVHCTESTAYQEYL